VTTMQIPIPEAYVARTPTSAALMRRAAAAMPGGSTRTVGWFAPYPVVLDHGDGPLLYDVDGHDYIDLFGNGLSLIHGHCYPPILQAAEAVLRRGTAWPGASVQQIEFAEMLRDRIPGAELTRFANSGTEAAMLAVKLARRATARPGIVKTWAGYHGSYDDLEAGLHGQGEIPGRVWLAEFGNLDSFRRVLEAHGHDVAAVMMEPAMFTGVVTPPPEGFLPALVELTHEFGALFVLDDCLMFRLHEQGSAGRYGFEADLTVLGKFIGGGTPVGAIVGKESLLSLFDPRRPDRLYHGGSFNGNVLGSACGLVAVGDLTQERIAAMDRRAEHLRITMEQRATEVGVPLVTSGVGSTFGVYAAESVPMPGGQRDDAGLSSLFQLAAVNRGVLFGDGGEAAIPTVLTDEVLEETESRVCQAIEDVAAVI
jgi:glutamate-1-semialdehyde 2,1-aminomutase